MLLKKTELGALSNYIKNKISPNLLAGTQTPTFIVVRFPKGEGIAVLAVLITDDRINPVGGYCVKDAAKPAYELNFTSNPCPDVLGTKNCTGILDSHKIEHFVEGGAIYASPPGEAEIQGLVGTTISNVSGQSYQIRRIVSADAGKTCGQIFGE